MALFAWAGRSELSGKQLEAWLSRVLVPVEPSPRFMGSLRARLVTYQGQQFPSVWFVVGVAASLLLILGAVVTHAIRTLLAVGSVVATVRQRRRAEAVSAERPGEPG
ncbi:MAG: hypothetical protein AB1449_00805 [Chloroflexota bacterium]